MRPTAFHPAWSRLTTRKNAKVAQSPPPPTHETQLKILLRRKSTAKVTLSEVKRT